jgi:hypothetical protein
LLEADGSFEYHVELPGLIFIPSAWVRVFIEIQTPMAAKATKITSRNSLPEEYQEHQEMKHSIIS